MKCKVVFLIAAVGCATLAAAETEKSFRDISKSIEHLTLAKAWELAEQFQPRLAEGKALVAATEGRVKQAGAFPNPEAIVRAESLPLNGSGSGEYLIGAAQEIPLNGVLAKARKVEMLDRERWQNELEAKRLEVRKKIQADFATALYQSKVRDSLAAISEHMSKAVSIAKARVEAGDVVASDLGRVEMEAARAQTAVREATTLREQAFVTLANSIGDPRLALKSLEGTLEAAFEIPTIESLATDLAAHPAAIAVAGEIEVGRARLDWVKAQRIPKVNIEVLYRRDQNAKRDGLDIGLTFPLPVFNRRSGKVQEVKAELAASEARSRSLKNELAFELYQSESRLSAALANARLFKNDILPRAGEILEVAETRYRGGETSLNDLIPIRRDWAEANLAYLESLRDVMLAWADLSSLVMK